MKSKTATALALTLACHTTSYASGFEQQKNTISLGITMGGESLGSVNGTSTSAGDGIFASYYGRIFPFGDSLGGQLNIGFKENRIGDADDEIYLYRFPLDALLFKQIGKVRLAAGISYHLAPTYRLKSSDGRESDIKLTSTIGTVVQADLFRTEHISFGLRYEVIRYESDKWLYNTATGERRKAFNADSVGLYMGAHF